MGPSGYLTVHPRWRGEHVLLCAGGTRAHGSSPLARGTQPASTAFGGIARFIPAGAGNTSSDFGDWGDRTVHPRWRGEHVWATQDCHVVGGSSPLARGTRWRRIVRQCWWRFIPAGAGNTARSPGRLRSPAVHPRWRGEHQMPADKWLFGDGSSPLARGTHLA